MWLLKTGFEGCCCFQSVFYRLKWRSVFFCSETKANQPNEPIVKLTKGKRERAEERRRQRQPVLSKQHQKFWTSYSSLLAPFQKKQNQITEKEKRHDEAIARGLFQAKNCTFHQSIGAQSKELDEVLNHGDERSFEMERIEIALAGRSNVGKSSLLNALFGSKEAFARTSKTPGRTQTLNFFHVQRCLALIDMPGYGYAKAPVQTVHLWHEMIANFLLTRSFLRHTFILVDARRGLEKTDQNLVEVLEASGVSYQFILTKIDRISLGNATNLIVDLNMRCRLLNHARFPVLPSSSKHQFGIDEIRFEVVRILRENGVEPANK